MPGAIEVVINWMIGIRSTIGRSPLATPWPGRHAAERGSPAAKAPCCLNAVRVHLRSFLERAGLQHRVRQSGVATAIRRHHQVADIVRLGIRLRAGQPAGW